MNQLLRTPRYKHILKDKPSLISETSTTHDSLSYITNIKTKSLYETTKASPKHLQQSNSRPKKALLKPDKNFTASRKLQQQLAEQTQDSFTQVNTLAETANCSHPDISKTQNDYPSSRFFHTRESSNATSVNTNAKAAQDHITIDNQNPFSSSDNQHNTASMSERFDEQNDLQEE